MARISSVLSNVLKLSVLLAFLTGERPVAAQESRDRDSGPAQSTPVGAEAQSRYLPPGGQPSGTYKLGWMGHHRRWLFLVLKITEENVRNAI